MRIALLFFFFLFSFVAARAQKFFGRAAMGYSFPLSNSRPVYLTGFPYTGGNSSPTDNAMFEVRKASMFSGVNGSAAVGIMFTKIGFEIGAATILSRVSHSFTQSLAIYPPGTTTTITQSVSNPTLLIPALVMRVPGPKVEVLLRAGVALPVYKKIFMDGETVGNGNSFSDHSELKTNFGTGLSFSGGAGYKLTRSLRLSLTLDILVMTLKAKELKLIKSTANGQDITGSKLPYQRSTIFVDDPSSYTFSADQPRQARAYSIPLGSKGISIGMSYQL